MNKPYAIDVGIVAVTAGEIALAVWSFRTGATVWGVVDAVVAALYAQWAWARHRRRRRAAPRPGEAVGDEQAARLPDGYFQVSPEVAAKYGAELLRDSSKHN